jgi:hypothetical protein
MAAHVEAREKTGLFAINSITPDVKMIMRRLQKIRASGDGKKAATVPPCHDILLNDSVHEESGGEANKAKSGVDLLVQIGIITSAVSPQYNVRYISEQHQTDSPQREAKDPSPRPRRPFWHLGVAMHSRGASQAPSGVPSVKSQLHEHDPEGVRCFLYRKHPGGVCAAVLCETTGFG